MVSSTLSVPVLLGRVWLAGAKFWEVEIAARQIEFQTGGFEGILRDLGD